MQLPDDFLIELFEQMRSLAEEHAKCKARLRAMEEARKMCKARLMRAAEASGAASSQTKQEAWAYAHPEYAQAVRDEVSALEDAEMAYWRLRMQEMTFEGWRTVSANSRHA